MSTAFAFLHWCVFVPRFHLSVWFVPGLSLLWARVRSPPSLMGAVRVPSSLITGAGETTPARCPRSVIDAFVPPDVCSVIDFVTTRLYDQPISMSLPLIFVFGLFLVEHAAGLNCYACSYIYTGTDRDMECVHSPWNVTQGGKETLCRDDQYCSTYRQYDYTLNAVRSFARLCAENDNNGNHCEEEVNFSRQDCFTTCQADLCNDSDGIPASPTPDDGDSVGHRTRTSYPLPKWKDAWNRWTGADNSGADAVCTSSLVCLLLLLCSQL
ncbi:hypothetical protein LSAT2_018519 [Lamellibrachia satsuma]|nr:hypothetical protein LSAT2_018519 [Lamellibrachia satsuma]